MRGRLVAAFCVVLGVPLLAQDPLYFVPADRVAVRVMRDVPPIDLAPGVHVRTVVGANGSVSIGDFDKDGAAVLHHHTREQADVGISGVFDMTIGTHVESLAAGAGVIVPANVEHSIANTRGGIMTVIEFHTIPRPDLVPPRPALTFPSSPVPVAVPDNRTLIAPLVPQPGAANATRVTPIRGKPARSAGDRSHAAPRPSTSTRRRRASSSSSMSSAATLTSRLPALRSVSARAR